MNICNVHVIKMDCIHREILEGWWSIKEAIFTAVAEIPMNDITTTTIPNLSWEFN